jgi:hypothetical protein
MAQQQLPPVNHAASPFGQTAAGHGHERPHFTSHHVIQHPNRTHVARPPATVFVEGDGAANGRAGNARHHPPFSGGGTISRGVKK